MSHKAPNAAAFFTLFDSVALAGRKPLLEVLQEVALVRGDTTVAHGLYLLSSAVEDDGDDDPPASSAFLPPSADSS